MSHPQYQFVDVGRAVPSKRRCAACLIRIGANVEFLVDGLHNGYVCFECARTVQREGVAAWKKQIADMAESARKLAERFDGAASSLDAEADVKIEMQIFTDPAGNNVTILENLFKSFDAKD